LLLNTETPRDGNRAQLTYFRTGEQ
jgi:hypothetical protein